MRSSSLELPCLPGLAWPGVGIGNGIVGLIYIWYYLLYDFVNSA